MAWLDGWSYRVKITVKASQVGGAALTDYPVYVNMAGLPAAFWTGRANMNDVRVTDSSGIASGSSGAGETLPWDIGYTDNATMGELYFKAASCSHLSDTVFYLYYGNTEASAPSAAEKAATWSAYAVVYLFSETPSETIGCLVNHVADSYHMEGASGTAAIYEAADMFVDGKFGKAWKTRAAGTAGSREWIQSATAIDFENASLTVTVWGNISDVSADGGILTNTTNQGQGWGLWTYGSELNFHTGVYDVYPVASVVGLSNQWVHFGGVHVHSGNSIAYVNGSPGSPVVGNTIDAGGSRCGFGGYSNALPTLFNQFFDGIFSQVRIATSAKGPEWLLGEYNNTSSPATFYEIGTVEEPPDTTPPTVTDLTLTPTGPYAPGDTVVVEWVAADDVAVASEQVFLSLDGGSIWEELLGPESGYYEWTVPDEETVQARIKVVATDTSDNEGEASTGDFTIAAPAAPFTGRVRQAMYIW